MVHVLDYMLKETRKHRYYILEAKYVETAIFHSSKPNGEYKSKTMQVLHTSIWVTT